MDEILVKQITEKIGAEATVKFLALKAESEKEISQKFDDLKKGLMTESSFESFKAEKMEPIQKTLDTLETAMKEQGNKMNAILEKAEPASKSLEQFIVDLGPKIIDLKSSGKYMEFTGAQLKAAGVNSIAGAIPTASPYAPGPSGPLEIFDVRRNPNFITSKVDLGRTDKAILAWGNELETIQGSASANVAEGGLKPQLQHQFEIATSRAKKAAGWVELTDEFEQDLPQFATRVRRAIQEDVERAWDDQIQIDVQQAAKPYQITDLDDQIQDANFWDAILAMMAQVGYYNFIPNAVAINWITNVSLKAAKNTNGTYLLPSFAGEINSMLTYANKMAVRHALVGDLKQYHVDIYKDFTLKVGWINDELIYNKFAIVGEMRYHSYISDNRKKALVYDSLSETAARIEGAGSL